MKNLYDEMTNHSKYQQHAQRKTRIWLNLGNDANVIRLLKLRLTNDIYNDLTIFEDEMQNDYYDYNSIFTS